MAYGAGRSRLFAERGREQAAERAEYERQVKAAEDARAKQSRSKSLWGGALSLLGGSLLGPVGLVAGKALGTFGADWASKAEDVDIDMDVGKFGVSKRHDYDAAQDMLDRADESEIWQDVTDEGTTAMTAFTLGVGSLKAPGNFSFTQYGGKDAGVGMGIFGKGEGGASLWDKWRGNTLQGSGNMLFKKPTMSRVPSSYQG